MKNSLWFGQLLTIGLIVLFGIIAFTHTKNKEEPVEVKIIDYDKDGISDIEEIVKNSKSLLEETNSDYVYTDIIWLVLKDTGYEFKNMINKDINENKEYYGINYPDEKIDYRNYENIKKYFDKYITKIEDDNYQNGDIIFYKNDIGIYVDNEIIHLKEKVFIKESILDEHIYGHYRFIIKEA